MGPDIVFIVVGKLFSVAGVDNGQPINIAVVVCVKRRKIKTHWPLIFAALLIPFRPA